MNAKHQFKYTYNETDLEEFSPLEVTFEVPGDATLTQMLYNFERYLEAAGFVFDGKLDFVEDTYPEHLDEIEQEPGYGCMADWDDEEIEAEEDCLKKCNEDLRELEEHIKDRRAEELKEMNERWNKLNYDQKMKIYKESIKESEDKYPIEPLYKKVGTLNRPSDSESDNCWNS